MVSTVERNVGAILLEALETVNKNFLAYSDHEYDEDDKVSVALEIELRSQVYTSLAILGEVSENAASELEAADKRCQASARRANEHLKRALEAERKLAQIRDATK